MSKHRVQEHDAVIRVLKSNELIDEHLGELHAKSIDAKLLTNGYQKAKLIREFDAKFGINLFNLSSKGEEARMEDGFFSLVKQAFGVSRAKPTNRGEILQLFVHIAKKATCKNIIAGKQGKTKEDRDKTIYTLNTALGQNHLDLNVLKNKKRRGFAPDVVEKFALQVLAEEGDCFLDEREDAKALDA